MAFLRSFLGLFFDFEKKKKTGHPQGRIQDSSLQSRQPSRSRKPTEGLLHRNIRTLFYASGTVTLLAVLAVVGVCVISIGVCVVEEAGEELTIVDHSLGYDNFWGYAEVTGTVKNTGDNTVEFGFVRVKFYDSSGNVIDTSSDSVQDLEPGETAKFEVACWEGEEVGDYEIWTE